MNLHDFLKKNMSKIKYENTILIDTNTNEKIQLNNPTIKIKEYLKYTIINKEVGSGKLILYLKK